MTQEERIERYFSGKMDDLERLAFDKEVMKDPKLATAVKEYQRILQGFKTYGLQQKLEQIMSEGSPNSNDNTVKSHRPTSYWVYIILAALLASGIYYTVVTNTEEETKTDIAPSLHMAYYYPDPGLPSKMGDNGEFDFDRGMVDYKLGHYKKAIEQWEKLSKGDAKTQYFLGAAYLADNNEDKAQSFFITLTEEDTFYDRAQWYLALISLKNNEIEASMFHLNTILEMNQSIYKDRARKLLSELPDK